MVGLKAALLLLAFCLEAVSGLRCLKNEVIHGAYLEDPTGPTSSQTCKMCCAERLLKRRHIQRGCGRLEECQGAAKAGLHVCRENNCNNKMKSEGSVAGAGVALYCFHVNALHENKVAVFRTSEVAGDPDASNKGAVKCEDCCMEVWRPGLDVIQSERKQSGCGDVCNVGGGKGEGSFNQTRRYVHICRSNFCNRHLRDDGSFEGGWTFANMPTAAPNISDALADSAPTTAAHWTLLSLTTALAFA